MGRHGHRTAMGVFDTAPWMRHAACKGEDQALFFPERGESLASARVICAGCPVREACLEYAIEHRIRHGVWGGTSERERRPLIRARRESA